MFNKRAIIFLLMILLAACLMSVTIDGFVAPPRVKHVDSTAEQYAKKKAENELKQPTNKPTNKPENKPTKQ